MQIYGCWLMKSRYMRVIKAEDRNKSQSQINKTL